jgi:hypothetical protein
MKMQTSFSERLARIEARARQGEAHGFVEPGPMDAGPALSAQPGPGIGPGVARLAFGGVAMLSVTLVAFVAGLWLLLPQDDAMALGSVARDVVLDHLSFGQGDAPAARTLTD